MRRYLKRSIRLLSPIAPANKKLRISSLALRRRLFPAFLTAALFSLLVFLPAYRFEDRDNRLTRLELAQMFESVLESCRIIARPDTLPVYVDLDDSQLFSVYRTLSCGLIKGFPQQEFKPNDCLRNIETIAYLQKLTLFLRQIKPESEVVRQLVRLTGYQDSSLTLMSRRLSNFMPEQLADPVGYTDREIMAGLVRSLIGQSTGAVLHGRVIDALTDKPLAGAFVASGRQTAQTGESGRFRIELPESDDQPVAVMAATEGYRPLELKKDLQFNREIVIRLRPCLN